MVSLVFLIVSLSLYLIGYSYSYQFMNKNQFMRENFPSINGENYSFYEIFEIQSLLFSFFIHYNIFYKKSGRLPVYDDKHNVVMNNFSKDELIEFINNNYIFFKKYSFIFFISGVLFVGSLTYFFMFEY